VKNKVLVVVIAACDPAPPQEGVGSADTGFRLVLDSGQSELVTDGDPCAPRVPEDTVAITIAAHLADPGTYLVCPRVPVTSTASETVLFLGQYSTGQASGDDVVVFAQAGSTVTATGARAVVVAHAEALVTVVDPDAAVVRCPSLVWSMAPAARQCPPG